MCDILPGTGRGTATRSGVVEGGFPKRDRWWKPPSTSLRLVPSFGLAMPRMAKDRPGDDPTQNSVPGRIA